MLRKFLGRRAGHPAKAGGFVLKHEELETRRLLAADISHAMAANLHNHVEEVAENADHGVMTTIMSHLCHGGRFDNSVSRTIGSLEAGIESGDLPGDLTAEDAQGIVDGLNAAVEAGDTDAISVLLAQVSAAKRLDSVRAEIAVFQAELDSLADGSETLYGLPTDDVSAALSKANEAVAAGDLDLADAELELIEVAQRAEEQAARNLARYASTVESLNARLAAAVEAGQETYRGVPIADAQAYADTATAAIEAGNADDAKTALDELKAMEQLIRNADRNAARVENLNAALAAAGEAGETTYNGLPLEDAQALADDANAALQAGDLAGVQSALSDLAAAVHLARETTKVETHLLALQNALAVALEAGETTVGDTTVEEVQAAIEVATAALAEGNLAEAEAAIKAVSPPSHAGHGRGFGGQHHGRGR